MMVVIFSVNTETNSSRRLQEQYVGTLRPRMVVSSKHLRSTIIVANNVGADFLKHTKETWAARSSVEPQHQWISARVALWLDQHIVKLSSAAYGLEVARIHRNILHSLRSIDSVRVVVAQSPMKADRLSTWRTRRQIGFSTWLLIL